jgi:vancomycin resistance protein YoaR
MQEDHLAFTQRTRRTPALSERFLIACTTGLILFFIILSIFFLGFQARYLGRVYPGVSVAGIDVSGMRRTQIANYLSEQFGYHKTGVITFVYDGKTWEYTPEQIGCVLDPVATAETAYKVGRTGWPWKRIFDQINTWKYGRDLAPHYVYDARIAQSTITTIASEINLPTVEASLQVNGLEVVVKPGQVGRTVDVYATSMLLGANLINLQNAIVHLIMVEHPPIILDASEQAGIAREILSQPLTLIVPGKIEDDPGPWVFEPETLATMLVIERVATENGEVYQVALDSDQLRSFLATIAPDLTIANPQNARFIYNDESAELELIRSAIIGRTLEIEASITHINQKIASGKHNINLEFDYTLPDVADDVTAEELGISELVSEETTYFFGSSSSRKTNISRAASQFHGLLIPPGATFSMVEYLGDVSLESGYAEALIIYGDRTIKGVGGGVCQVSTTLFRTVFFGGYPIVERYPHSYRVYYYEQNSWGGVNENLAGLDATVYAPIVDFKFTNDSVYWLLMETYVSANSLTWKFYSSSDGRVIEWDTTGPVNPVPPPDPIYEVNEDLPKGKIKQVDWAAEGADVIVERQVYREGDLVFSDTIATHYNAWADVFQCGPDTKGCPPEELEKVNKDKEEE